MDALKNNLEKLGIFEDLEEIIIPGKKRIQVQENLLQLFEPGIFADPELNLPGISQTTRLSMIYMDLGIYSTAEIIVGTCPQSSSVNLILDLTNLVLSSPMPIAQADILINYISTNPKIFSPEIKLFPQTFPSKFIATGNIVSDLQSIKDYWNQEFSRISLHAPSFSDQPMPTSADLQALRNSIDSFCKELKVFRKAYEEKLSSHMLGGHEKNTIGKWAKSCVASYEKLCGLLHTIEEIWSYINILIN